MKTYVTIKIKPENADDLTANISGWLNELTAIMHAHYPHVIVRGLVDFSLVSPGRDPAIVDEVARSASDD